MITQRAKGSTMTGKEIRRPFVRGSRPFPEIASSERAEGCLDPVWTRLSKALYRENLVETGTLIILP